MQRPALTVREAGVEGGRERGSSIDHQQVSWREEIG